MEVCLRELIQIKPISILKSGIDGLIGWFADQLVWAGEMLDHFKLSEQPRTSVHSKSETEWPVLYVVEKWSWKDQELEFKKVVGV